ncbi:hypothetical protein IAE57_19830 [Stenotrophomonas sp. S48]|uniref:hypothetical protein n=1 Tax=unclassified Stenotrophomonas TaxID=196198 RepID=UPI0018FF1979|nr:MULTISPECIES: hypothetical protein [unclassified Stenotrophomonas]MBK0028414.1 hypothetical protein [Stenotrophomonas sp. S48]MBK0050258.1 hypothetical protein [Stenotrophomonas sp. S49]
MRARLMLGLALVAGPALADPPPPAPTSAWLERQQVSAADEANAASAKPSKKPEAKEHCRVAREWKVGQTVVEHKVCEDPPKELAGKV